MASKESTFAGHAWIRNLYRWWRARPGREKTEPQLSSWGGRSQSAETSSRRLNRAEPPDKGRASAMRQESGTRALVRSRSAGSMKRVYRTRANDCEDTAKLSRVIRTVAIILSSGSNTSKRRVPSRIASKFTKVKKSFKN